MLLICEACARCVKCVTAPTVLTCALAPAAMAEPINETPTYIATLFILSPLVHASAELMGLHLKRLSDATQFDRVNAYD
jgi:hypothetical protein